MVKIFYSVMVLLSNKDSFMNSTFPIPFLNQGFFLSSFWTREKWRKERERKGKEREIERKGITSAKNLSLSGITDAMQNIIKKREPFQRIELPIRDALEFFEGNKYKKYFIEKAGSSSKTVTLYRCGDLIDLCRGPHLQHTGMVRWISLIFDFCFFLSILFFCVWIHHVSFFPPNFFPANEIK